MVTAEDRLTAHPLDAETYGVDFTARLPSGVTVASATVTQTLIDGTETSDLTIGTPAPNSATFVNAHGEAVAVGAGVQFVMTGGTSGTDYYLTVAATCSDSDVRVVVCVVEVRSGLSRC